jgi:hypothetical protein
MAKDIIIGKTYSFQLIDPVPLLKLSSDGQETDTVFITVKKFKPIDTYIIDYHLEWIENHKWNIIKNFVIGKNDLLKILIANNAI